MCTHLSLCFHSQWVSRKIFPEQKSFLGFLPGKTVTVILKLTLPPGRQNTHTHTHTHTHSLEVLPTRFNIGVFKHYWPKCLQLIQHPLHLLVDLIGRRAARLLIFSPASLALRHAQFVSVPALRRLPTLLSGPAVQSGGGRGHLLGGDVFIYSDICRHTQIQIQDANIPGTCESCPHSSSAGRHHRGGP